MSWSLGLEERGVIVTGAAGGIGRSVAHAFASAGARVAAVDVDGARCEHVVAELEAPDRHLALGVDLSNISAHQALTARVTETFGRLDVLAHLAAVLRRRHTIDEISEEDWDVQIDTNLKTTFFLNRCIAQAFREHGRGRAHHQLRVTGLVDRGVWGLGRLRSQQRRRRLAQPRVGPLAGSGSDHGQHGGARAPQTPR